ncbi:MAG: NUDIX domain-containing protein [Acidobacteriota bacterium]
MTKALTHAGTVAFRKRGSQVLYLVVSSSDGFNWVLPKGHIDPGETPELAALRELAEEAGVLGAIVFPLPESHYERAGREFYIKYFLVREVGSTESIEKRTIRWEEESAALELLTFTEAKDALLAAAPVARSYE